MLKSIVHFSVRNRLLVLSATLLTAIGGIIAMLYLPIDAVPDITNNQVQIITRSSGLSAEDVERLLTYPIERAVANLPKVEEVRSISRFGMSLVTVVFHESVPTLQARQLVAEQIAIASLEIPPLFGQPEMMPITTGLGEIYQYTIEVEPALAGQYSLRELRSIQDWLIKRQLTGIEGIIEISSFGGEVKQYEVSLKPERMAALGISAEEVAAALLRNNANTGGGYMLEGNKAIYLRTDGMASSLADIANINVTELNGAPVLVSHLATVQHGSALRYGALTRNGQGEAVGGITLLLKDANAKATVERVKARIAEIQSTLPPGLRIVPYLDRSILVSQTISTAVENLAIGGLVVGLVLIFFLGDYRAGLIVASIIPLSMLFALILMKAFGVSANLMSLGAVDLGIVVDGAVIVVEGILHAFAAVSIGNALDKQSMHRLIEKSTVQIYSSAAFGVLIILVVFVPVLYLGGIEGKMFRPMAFTLIFALAGALILSMTYVPAAAATWLKPKPGKKPSIGARWMLQSGEAYRKWLHRKLPRRRLTLAILLLAFTLTLWRMGHMGAVFVPELEEGDLAMQVALPAGSSLEAVVKATTEVERTLMNKFPEVKGVVSKIGTAEIPTDPMAIEDADVMILLKPKDEWTSANNRSDLVALMQEALDDYPELEIEFSQPIQLRFNELISGSKADIAVKVFGPDNAILYQLGRKAEALIEQVPGADDVKLERTEGLMQYVIKPQRDKLAQYGLSVDDVNLIVQSVSAGVPAGSVYEDERRFDMVMRLDEGQRNLGGMGQVLIPTPQGQMIPLSAVAHIERHEGVAMVSRERAQRRISIGVNVRQRSLTEVVADIRNSIEANLALPPGYSIRYEGEFRNYQEAVKRLSVAVPVSLGTIVLLLYFAFRKWRYALLVFSAVPFTTIGGIWALSARGIPFSISAGIGFIALFGVGVLNSIVLISHINHVRSEAPELDLQHAVSKAAAERFRPVLLTALTAVLGFLPMALSSNVGAEVQRPLATVVIGGLFVDTFLTLVYLPKMYLWLEGGGSLFGKKTMRTLAAVALICGSSYMTPLQAQEAPIAWEDLERLAFANNPELALREMALDMEKARTGENWLLPPTRVDYGYGQLNEVPSAQDYQWLFSQEFGSIPEHINRSRRQEARIASAQAELAAFRKDFEVNLKADYLRWVMAQERLNATEAYHTQLAELMRQVTQQAQVGEITEAEQLFFEAELMRVQRELSNLKVAKQIARLGLEQRCQFSLEGQGPADGLSFGLMQVIPDSLYVQRFTQAQEQRINEGQYQLKMQRSAFFPSLSAGYQRARLENISGGDAYFLGLAFPLWYGPDKSRSHQAAIALAGEQLKLEASRFNLAAESRQAMEACLEYRQLFEERGATFAEKAAQLRQKASRAFEVGETTIYQLQQALSTAQQLHMEYLQLAEDYGLARIHLTRYQAP